MPITDADLVNWFSYHAPADTSAVAQTFEAVVVPEVGKPGFRSHDATSCYEYIRAAGLEMARVVLEYTPASADQSAAIRKIREAVMTANAAVACGGK